MVALLLLAFRGTGSSSQPATNRSSPTTVEAVVADASTADEQTSDRPEQESTPVIEKQDPIAEAMKSVVRLETDNGSLGSGFLVGDAETVATNLHVVAGSKAITAKFADGSEIEIDGFMHASLGLDLAMLHLSSPALSTPLDVAREDVPLGVADVYAIGMPKGLPFSVSKGVISAYRIWRDIKDSLKLRQDPHDDDGKWVQTTTPISPGNSGGPLLTASGQVLGINTMSLASRDTQNLNFSLRSTELQGFLDRKRHIIRDLAQLPESPAEESPTPGDRAATQAADREAWDNAALAVGIFLKNELMNEQVEHLLQTPEEIRNRRLATAGAALNAFERISRAEQSKIHPLLWSYLEALRASLTSRRQSLMSEQRTATKGPGASVPRLPTLIEVVTTESGAVKARLEFLHGGDWRNAIGVEEEDLDSWWFLARQSESYPPRAAPAPPKGGWLYEQVFVDMCIDSYHRAREAGGGKKSLAYIIRLFPGLREAAWAEKELGGKITPELLRELAPLAVRSENELMPDLIAEETEDDGMRKVRAKRLRQEVEQRIANSKRNDPLRATLELKELRRLILSSDDLDAEERHRLSEDIVQAITDLATRNTPRR